MCNSYVLKILAPTALPYSMSQLSQMRGYHYLSLSHWTTSRLTTLALAKTGTPVDGKLPQRFAIWYWVLNFVMISSLKRVNAQVFKDSECCIILLCSRNLSWWIIHTFQALSLVVVIIYIFIIFGSVSCIQCIVIIPPS